MSSVGQLTALCSSTAAAIMSRDAEPHTSAIAYGRQFERNTLPSPEDISDVTRVPVGTPPASAASIATVRHHRTTEAGVPRPFHRFKQRHQPTRQNGMRPPAPPLRTGIDNPRKPMMTALWSEQLSATTVRPKLECHARSTVFKHRQNGMRPASASSEDRNQQSR